MVRSPLIFGQNQRISYCRKCMSYPNHHHSVCSGVLEVFVFQPRMVFLCLVGVDLHLEEMTAKIRDSPDWGHEDVVDNFVKGYADGCLGFHQFEFSRRWYIRDGKINISFCGGKWCNTFAICIKLKRQSLPEVYHWRIQGCLRRYRVWYVLQLR